MIALSETTRRFVAAILRLAFQFAEPHLDSWGVPQAAAKSWVSEAVVVRIDDPRPEGFHAGCGFGRRHGSRGIHGNERDVDVLQGLDFRHALRVAAMYTLVSPKCRT